MMTRSQVSAAVLALTPTGPGAARAQNQEGDAAAQAFTSAPVQLTQAIAAAEADRGGKVMSIELSEGGNGEPAGYDAEVLQADGSSASVFVDATDGTAGPDDPSDDAQGAEHSGMESGG